MNSTPAGPDLAAQLRDGFAQGRFGDWAPVLHAWSASPQGQALVQAVATRIASGATVYPPRVFRAFELTPLSNTKVVILGQDPYHGPGQAEGLAFSVPSGQPVPPSLRNIFAELKADLGLTAPASGSLKAWGAQGVLLLNTCLTVEDAKPASHAKLGWQALTDSIIQALAEDAAPKVFCLWGAHAQNKLSLTAGAAPGLERQRAGPGQAHLLLCANHPSPLSARRGPVPFLGCRHFSQAAQFLAQTGRLGPTGSADPGLFWRLAA